MENRRKRGEAFPYVILAALTVLFGVVLGVLVIFKAPPEVITLLGGWGGTILTMIGVVVSFEFGSSKGSQMKDESAARKQGDNNEPPPNPPAVAAA